MKKTIITLLLALVLTITASAQLESVKELTMKSEYFNHERQVLNQSKGQIPLLLHMQAVSLSMCISYLLL